MNSNPTPLTKFASANRVPFSPTPSPFSQRFTTNAAVRARFPAPPLGRLVDPFLLDRLQAPLTRFRE
jgi:hypothetical protein